MAEHDAPEIRAMAERWQAEFNETLTILNDRCLAMMAVVRAIDVVCRRRPPAPPAATPLEPPDAD